MPKGHPMQVTVACHQCDQPKRPLSPCSGCGATPLAEPEMQAWRLSLHARHLARIKATPRAAEIPARDSGPLSPMAVTVTLDFELELAPDHQATVLPFIPFDPQPLDRALDFDWDDEPRKRSA
jgi:hypothetical protein